MSEQPEEVQTFVRKGPGGVERTHHFAPWPEGQVKVRVMMVEVREGGGELRHLSYDDPPGIFSTPDEYREALAQAAAASGSLEDFTLALVRGLGRDLVFSHGVEPQDAVRAITEFAEKVYRDLI